MKFWVVPALLAVAVSSYSCARSNGAPVIIDTSPPATEHAKVSFETDIEPILKAKYQSCHFPGGRMYDKLPFDRAETIQKLGTKLFTRIRDENDQKLIRQFLSQS